MFNTLADVPNQIKEFYVVKNATVTEKPRGELRDDVAAILVRQSTRAVVEQFLGFANAQIDWAYHDAFLAWFNRPKPQAIVEQVDGVNTSVWEDGFSWEDYLAQPEPNRLAHKQLSDYPEYLNWVKLEGVMFEGVRCSATKEDMWGLKSVEDLVKSGTPVNFHFDSGDTLALTSDNIEAFQKVWLPFRLQFFQ